MKVEAKQLIDELIQSTRRNLDAVEGFSKEPYEKLNQRGSEKHWSAFECIEHLNRYSDFYLPEIARRIENANTPADKIFVSGLLGNYFAESMRPRKNLRKIRTFKDKDPIGSDLDKSVLIKFVQNQRDLLDLLTKAREISLRRTRTSVSIATWIKLRLGDTLRVVVYHNERHLMQAEKAIEGQ